MGGSASSDTWFQLRTLKIKRVQLLRLRLVETLMLCDVHDGHGPLTRYVKSRVAHAPGMPGTFSPPHILKETASQRSRHASRHVRHARAVMHVGIANPRWWGKRSRHSRCMRNPQFCVSGKRPIMHSFSSSLYENQCVVKWCHILLFDNKRFISISIHWILLTLFIDEYMQVLCAIIVRKTIIESINVPRIWKK